MILDQFFSIFQHNYAEPVDSHKSPTMIVYIGDARTTNAHGSLL